MLSYLKSQTAYRHKEWSKKFLSCSFLRAQLKFVLKSKDLLYNENEVEDTEGLLK